MLKEEKVLKTGALVAKFLMDRYIQISFVLCECKDETYRSGFLRKKQTEGGVSNRCALIKKEQIAIRLSKSSLNVN